MPSRMTVSIESRSPTPSIRQKTASLIIGTRMRLEMKPGWSFASATVLPIALGGRADVGGGLVGRVEAADQLHERHQRHAGS